MTLAVRWVSGPGERQLKRGPHGLPFARFGRLLDEAPLARPHTSSAALELNLGTSDGTPKARFSASETEKVCLSHPLDDVTQNRQGLGLPKP
jgi:hypothetical protein